MEERLTDYDYVREFFINDLEELDRFVRFFNGVRISVSLSSHKRFQAQVLLLRGNHPTQVAKELEMKIDTIWQIRKRMQDNLMYAAKEEAAR